jgi:hypothetical protein
VGLLLGCLVVALGATHATIAGCPELAEALGGPRVRRPGLDGGMFFPMTPRQTEKSQAAMLSDRRLAAGTEAPDFTLPDASGRPVTLRSFRGKRPVVLVFGSFG